MTEPERPPTLHLVLAWAAVYLIWGSTYLGIRVAIESIPPFLMAGSRHLLAGLLLYAWSRLRQAAPAPSRQDWIRATGLGVLMLVTANGATTWAEQLVPSGLTALIVCTSALWLVLLNWLWLGATRPGARTIAGILAGFGGVALLVVPGNFGGSEHVDPIGALVLTGAALSWSVGSIYAIKLSRPAHPTRFVAQQMIAAGEESGKLGEVLDEISAYYQKQLREKIKAVTSMIEPIMIILMGSVVGFIAMAIILPIFKMSSLVK